MRVIKNVICGMLALMILVQPFLSIPNTGAQTPPAPSTATSWYLVWKEGKYLLKHKDVHATPDKYYELVQTGGKGTLKRKWSTDATLNGDTVAYMIKGLNPKYYVLVTDANAESSFVSAICQISTSEIQNMRTYNLEFSRQDRGWWFDNTENQIYRCISSASNLVNVDPVLLKGEGNNYLNNLRTETTPQDTIKMLGSMWNSMCGGDRCSIPREVVPNGPLTNRVFKKGRTGVAPKPENLPLCRAKGAKPIFFNNATARADFDKGIADLKTQLLAKPENQGNTQYINDYYGKPENINEIFNAVGPQDEAIFRQFYGDPTKEYPTVPPSEGKYAELVEIYQDLQQSLPSDDRESWDNIYIKSAMAVGLAAAGAAVAVATAGTAAPAIIAALSTGAAGGFSSNLITGGIMGSIAKAEFKAMMPKLYKYMVAAGYLMANEAYNECLADKDDPYAMPNPRLAQMLTSLTASATDVLSGVDKGDKCDQLGAGFSVGLLIKKGFCGLILAMKDFADWLFLHAKNWLSISLGVAENKDMDLPVDAADPAPGGAAPPGGETPPGGTPDPGTANPSNSVTLARSVLKTQTAADANAIRTQAASSSNVIRAGIIPKDGTTLGQSTPATVTVDAAHTTSGEIKISILSQTNLTSASQPKFLVQFIANNVGYQITLIKNGTTNFNIGQTSGKDVIKLSTPPTIPQPGVTPSTTTTCPNAPAADTIRGKAAAFCQTKKATNPANWNNGPCLTQNLNNTGYAVDVAHSPRTAVDDRNTCSRPTKWVELDTNCCVIGAQPSNTN